jgi:hypothetical protein
VPAVRPPLLGDQHEASAESGIARIDSRACSLDDDGLGKARELQDDCPLDRRSGADPDLGFVIAGKTLKVDVKRVVAWWKNRESQLPSFVRRRRLLTADQRRRGETDDGGGQGASLRVLDGADESARQGLRARNSGKKDASDASQQNQATRQHVRLEARERRKGSRS